MENQNIFDRKAINNNHKRWANKYNSADFLFRFSEEEIVNRLKLIKRDFDDIAIIGERSSGILLEYLNNNNANIDIVEIPDNEILPFQTDSYDLIISIMELHKVNNIKQLFLQIRYCLKNGGAFLGVMAGEENLKELRKSIMMAEAEISNGVYQRVHPVMSMKSISGLLQDVDFSMPVVDSEKLEVSYKNCDRLIKDLRYMGESNATSNRCKKFTKSALFKKNSELYGKYYTNKDGRVNASFDLMFLTGWADN